MTMLQASAPRNTVSPDDLDDLSAKTSATTAPLVDEIEAEHGPLVFIDENTVKPNLPALAKKFAATCSVAYAARSDSFSQYSNEEGIWHKLEKKDAMWLAASFLKAVADDKKAILLLPKISPSLVRALLEFVKGCSPQGDPPPHSARLLPVANGVLDLSGPEPVLRPFNKDDWFTSKVPWAYVPGARCERFLNELVCPALPDPDDVSLLQRDFGRQLIAGNDAQTFSVITGDGGSGKGVLVSILERMIGTSKVAHLRSDKLQGRFETHGFQGKSTLSGKDVSPDYLSNKGAAVIKSLTGADRIESEQKYGGKFELRGDFYVVITSNSRLPLKVQGDATAWRRRLVCYHFNRDTPAKRIPNFDVELLREEGEGILAWLIQGFLAHQTELREHGSFRLTEPQTTRIENWIEESESEVAFLRKEVTKGVGTLSSDELYDGYVKFARARGWRALAEQTFRTRLRPVMVELFGVDRDTHIVRNGSLIRGYKRVVFKADKLKEETEREP